MPRLSPAQLLHRFTVIGLDLPLSGDPAPRFRKFIVLKHFPDDSFLVALAPITRIQPYRQDPELSAGCVSCAPGEVPGFSGEIVIEPRQTHRHALGYLIIEQAINRGAFRDFGLMQGDFQIRFPDAIERNRLLNREEKQDWRILVS